MIQGSFQVLRGTAPQPVHVQPSSISPGQAGSWLRRLYALVRQQQQGCGGGSALSNTYTSTYSMVAYNWEQWVRCEG